MAAKIDSNLLNDTLNVVQLARQAALAKGNKERVSALEAIADSLQQVAASSLSENSNQATGKSSLSAAEVKNRAFKSLLKTVQEGSKKNTSNSAAAIDIFTPEVRSNERNQIIAAMADAGMSDVEIARQFGITRAEVHAVLSLYSAHKEGRR